MSNQNSPHHADWQFEQIEDARTVQGTLYAKCSKIIKAFGDSFPERLYALENRLESEMQQLRSVAE